MAVQIVIGYEWFMFDRYESFLECVAIPNASGFGYLLELSKLPSGSQASS